MTVANIWPDSIPLIDGITYRQIDYWARRGYIHPIDDRPGSGVAREWPEAELDIARTMARLVAAGLTPFLAHKVARHGPDIAPGIRVVVEA